MGSKRLLTLMAALSRRTKSGHWLLLWCAMNSLWLVLVSAQPHSSPRASQGKQAVSPLDREYLTTRWTTEEGLPQNTITAIVQTRDGYLWLGTFGGLARFDGARFTIFNSANTPQLKSNRITALLEDRDGSLWIGAETGEIARYRHSQFASWPGTGATIMSFYQDRTGLIWAVRLGLNPLRFAPEQPDKADALTTVQGFASESWCTSVSEDRGGKLWAAAGKELKVWRDGVFTASRIEGLPDETVFRVAPQAHGDLWIITQQSMGIVANGRFTPALRFSAGAGYLTSQLIETRDGQLWFGNQENALWRSNSNELGLFTPVELKNAATNPLRALLEDREGNIWLGTQGGGLVRLRSRAVTTISQTDGLPSNDIYALGEDGRGAVWFAMSAGMGSLFEGKKTFWTEADLKKSINAGYPITFYRHEAGKFWLGGVGHIAQVRDGQLEVHELKGFPHWVTAILADRQTGGQESLWLGLLDVGVARYRDGQITQVYRPSDGLVDDLPTVLLEDRSGALWIGTRRGLSRLKDGVFTNWTSNNGLSNDFVRALYEDQDGAIWIGTYGGGLNRLKDGRITHITAKNGLFDDTVSRLLVDDRDRFWMLGNRGIYFVSRQQLNDFADGQIKSIACGSYGVADGMLSSEGNGPHQPAGWRMRDGRMWFPTINGIAIVDPHQQPETPPPPAVIEQVKLDREVDDFGRGIEIAPGWGNLEIHYTGLHFGKPDQVRFRYKLDGLTGGWIDAGTRRSVSYSYLPPGKYTFQVVAANPDSMWSEVSASLSIVVRPPYYRTWWFISLAVTALAGVALLGYKLRVRKLIRAQVAQEEFSRQLISSQENERQRIAAALHDSLGQDLLVIKNWARMAQRFLEPESRAREPLDEVATAALRSIEEVREIAYELRPYDLDEIGLTEALQSMLERVGDSSGISFTVQIDPIDKVFSSDAEINLYRVMQECVNNIVKHSQATAAEVSVRRDSQTVVVVIKDNGVGFKMERVASDKAHGFGLTSIAERVRMLSGKESIQSAPGKGTTITITLECQESTDEDRNANPDR
jgi:signal transduction histidine kinase/ligand-binding sensor domain-containing protein